MTKMPSRILNEKMGLFGLSVLDLAGIGYILIFSNQALSKFKLELLSFVIAGFAFVSLFTIRLKFRAKFIRDFISYKLSKRF